MFRCGEIEVAGGDDGADLRNGGRASAAMREIIGRMAQLKCKDRPDVAQLRVEESGGWGDWLRLVFDFRFCCRKGSRRVRLSSRLASTGECEFVRRALFSFCRINYLLIATKKGEVDEEKEKEKEWKSGRCSRAE